MVANVIVGMLCLHLLCFAVLFMLIGRRLEGPKQGMNMFALASLLLAVVYVLQLLDGTSSWGWMSIANHSLMFCSVAAYWLGGFQFFSQRIQVAKTLLTVGLGYTALQFAVYYSFGLVARYGMLSVLSAVIFLVISGVLLNGVRSFARDVRTEAIMFACIVGGLGVLNAVKAAKIFGEGMEALEMDTYFQVGFYAYMSFMATVLAPSLVWLVLRRLMDALRETAARDPLTQLLNRRGLKEHLQSYFRLRHAQPAYLLMVDIDHFKRINDTYGHQAGDDVLCRVAQVLTETARQGDLISRTGGEEFLIVCLETDAKGIERVAERMRMAVEAQHIQIPDVQDVLQCTVTIGVSSAFTLAEMLESTIQQADAALYRGKESGRNRVEVHETLQREQATTALPVPERISQF